MQCTQYAICTHNTCVIPHLQCSTLYLMYRKHMKHIHSAHFSQNHRHFYIPLTGRWLQMDCNQSLYRYVQPVITTFTNIGRIFKQGRKSCLNNELTSGFLDGWKRKIKFAISSAMQIIEKGSSHKQTVGGHNKTFERGLFMYRKF